MPKQNEPVCKAVYCVIMLTLKKIKHGDYKRSPWLPRMRVYRD